MLDELRVMTNLVHGGASRVRLVVAGSSALEESFAHPELESFNQRLSARCYLTSFGREETAQFVRAQLAAAGAAPEKAFASDAAGAIFDATDGVPRLVNQLCDRALLVAQLENRTLVDSQTVQEAWADLQQLPVAWETRSSTAEASRASGTIEFGTLSGACGEIVPAIPIDNDSDDAIAVAGLCEARPELPGSQTPATVSETVSKNLGDPFAEAYDEEEVVFDRFAAWEDIVHSGTPRVENRRDKTLVRLIQAAVDATTTINEPQMHAAPELDDLKREEFAIDELRIPADAAAADTSQAIRPRLKLADVPEISAEPLSFDSAPAPRSGVEDSQNVPRIAIDSDAPILTIEEEPSLARSSSGPVRRLSYQHLFSRLRSG
jgi:hypothetical protein